MKLNVAVLVVFSILIYYANHTLISVVYPLFVASCVLFYLIGSKKLSVVVYAYAHWVFLFFVASASLAVRNGQLDVNAQSLGLLVIAGVLTLFNTFDKLSQRRQKV